MRTITFKAEDHVDDWLESEARALRVSKSQIVRNAVEKIRREKAAPSCHDLMKDVCGSLRSGVKDLATNNKYMRGFGEWKR
jgi:hypothetical protein